ncbi:MAG: ribonuclease III [Alphaproteobacteria bacterium]|nr:ribonuclease III [Alphaproteobacteria bacterium]
MKDPKREFTYNFNNPELYELALTQSGVDSENNNERLEFLGDRVLGLIIAKMLYDLYPTEAEGALARRHSVLVSTETLARVANIFSVGDKLHHGHLTGGRVKHVLANAMEAILGAIYIDGGMAAATDFVDSVWGEFARAEMFPPKDPKTKLQEFVQKHAKGTLPVYEYLSPVGATNNPVFGATVTAMGKSAGGTGTSKKLASIAAASALLKILEKGTGTLDAK